MDVHDQLLLCHENYVEFHRTIEAYRAAKRRLFEALAVTERNPDKGWGKQSHWTHFDGYQVLSNGGLRALVGGDARYGGLNDLVSIAVDDERDGVIARFAVIRRARQVMRWR